MNYKVGSVIYIEKSKTHYYIAYKDDSTIIGSIWEGDFTPKKSMKSWPIDSWMRWEEGSKKEDIEMIDSSEVDEEIEYIRKELLRKLFNEQIVFWN